MENTTPANPSNELLHRTGGDQTPITGRLETIAAVILSTMEYAGPTMSEPTDELIERVAMAIGAAPTGFGGWRTKLQSQSRAAIAAIRTYDAEHGMVTISRARVERLREFAAASYEHGMGERMDTNRVEMAFDRMLLSDFDPTGTTR